MQDHRRLSITVVIPARNEAENIGEVVREAFGMLRTAFHDHSRDVVVVDNGSSDATARVAASAGARVINEPVAGYGRACLAGARAATGEVLVFMDGDLSDQPSEIPLLVEPILRDAADLVIGSRTLGYAERGALTAPQRAGNAVASFLLRRRYGLEVTDLGPFRAVRRADLLALGMTEMSFGWPTEMMARSSLAGLRVLEVPVTYRKRAAGRSKVSGNPRAVVLAGWQIMSVIRRVRRAEVPRLRNVEQ